MLYLEWLRRATDTAMEMHRERPFDVSFPVTYSAYWLPSRAVALGIPSVWGPIGGAVTTPLPLWAGLGFGGMLGEVLDYAAVRFAARLPATRRSWRDATVRLFNNAESMAAMPDNLPGTSIVLNNAPFADVDVAAPAPREPFVVFPSPLDPRKGPRLALQALAYTRPQIRLAFAADGIERRPLERMAARLGLSDRVDFLGWIPRPQMFELLASAAASIHTGLREEGGVALTEAMIHGTPVIVLAHGGARTIAETGTDPHRIALVPPGRFIRTSRRIAREIDRLCASPSTAVGPTIDQAAYHRQLRAAFDLALGVIGTGPDEGASQP
jgi:glycosyltransferase involved in cell wall biosynthesis